MELRHLRYFIAVAELQSFSRAAKTLHISQSAISEQIADLETEIGAKLLERGPRRTLLTQSGHVLLKHARVVLEASAAAILETQRAERGEVGTLRIGFFAGGLGEDFPGLVRGFRTTHPHVELSLMEMTPTQQWAALTAGRIDIAFTRMPEPQFRRDIRFEVIRQDPIFAILPRVHRLAKSKLINMKDLAAERFVLSARDVSPAVYDKALELCSEAGFSPEIASISSVWSSVTLMVRSGEGIALQPLNQQQSAERDLVFLPLKGANTTVEMCLCWSTNNDRPLMRTFRELIRKQIRSGARL